eukprot:Gb_22262 [translate_table: standard]
MEQTVLMNKVAVTGMFKLQNSSCLPSSNSCPCFAVLPVPQALQSFTKPSHKLYFTRTCYPSRRNACRFNCRRNSIHHATTCCTLAERSVEVSKANGLEDVPTRLNRILAEFKTLEDPRDRVRRLLEYSSLLPPLPPCDRVSSNRVMGCTAQVWLTAELGSDGRMYFGADSDSEITRGFCACLINSLNGALPEEMLQVKTEDLSTINIGVAGGAKSRANAWHNVLISIQKRTQSILARKAGKPPVEPFPSFLVTAEDISAQGSFAEAQVTISLL